ncbi:ABC transporter permease [Streptomyces sp. RB17]|uniref:ABC transporter permease n=1 Tax=Streptomyces sp. RB17 TaxID=2585197 RepID=UPI0012965881|nr:ABC transporter permease [Streptomyces sp. RB17]
MLAAERIKLFSQRSTYVLLALTPVITVCGEWFTCSGVHLVGASAHTAYDPLRGSFNSGTWGFLMVGAGILGTLAMSSEYSSGLIRTTFLAVPNRRRVVLAKAVVVASVTSVVGLITAIASFITAQTILSGDRLGIPIGQPGVLQGFVASTAILPVCAVIGMAVGTLIRTSAAALFTTVLAPVLLGAVPTGGNQLTAALSNSAPQNAWNTLTSLGTEWDSVGPFPPTALQSWTALAFWPLLTLLAALIVVRRREV